MADEREREQAVRASKYYTLDAQEYLEGFCRIDRTEPRDLHLSHVKIYLLGQSLEIALKGWLVLREGTSIRDLRHRYGHNLSRLVEAVEPYYPEIAPWREVINHFSENYAHRDYQYAEREPDPDAAGEPDLCTRAGFSPMAEFAEMVGRCIDQLTCEIAQARR